jgi:ribosomal protein S18 acetylase RimI-like enzyme
MTGIVTTRPVGADDQAFIYRAFESSREAEFSLLGWPPEKVEELMRSQFELQTNGYSCTFPQADHLVIMLDGEPVGRVIVNESDVEIRMVDIAILTSFRRRGIGRSIVRMLMDVAEKARKPLRHQVYHGELDAIRFYFAMGYQVVESGEAAFKMEWQPASMKAESQAETSRA